MENPFFTALEQQGHKATALATQSNSVLMPFIYYLNNSIEALKKKEVVCTWKPVANKCYQLKADKRIWRLVPLSEIEIVAGEEGWFEILMVDGELVDADFDPDENDPILQGKGKGRCETKIPAHGYNSIQNHLYLPNFELNDDPISWSGYQLELRPLAVQLEQLDTVHISGQEYKVIHQDGVRLTLQGHVKAHSQLTIAGRDTQFSLIKGLDESLLTQWQATSEGSNLLLFSDTRPKVKGYPLEDVTNTQFKKISCEHFLYQKTPLHSDDWELRFEIRKKADAKPDRPILRLENHAHTELEESTSLTCTAFPQLTWTVELAKVEDKWIQLIEKEGGVDTGKSDLDYFFSDQQNIKILDSTQHKHDDGFRILKSRPDERQILLARNVKGKKCWNSEYPSQKGHSCELRVSVDISQLRKQKDAINQLKNRPSKDHWPLIQILQSRELTHWPTVQPTQIPEDGWRVLKDPNFDGCDRQREFVTKALANQDFTILDGPPGTGKTTTILELIIQLVLQGKRVLLSASTHAAINNVLERIKDNSTLSAHIFPLRIGNENNAIGVEEYQFDNLLESLQTIEGCDQFSKQIMVDSSNLVCGTTIGILRLFNDPDIYMNTGESPFDVMIIDECSKTTFQEFLVPARFAKRWVLVGDVKQLSPFTDREQIVANLDHLMLVPPKGKTKGQYLSQAIQQACFLLEELRGDQKTPYSQPMLVPVTNDVAKALVQELHARNMTPQFAKGLDHILVVMKEESGHNSEPYQVGLQKLNQSPSLLYRYPLCFVEDRLLEAIQGWIPDDMLILHPCWGRTLQAGQHLLLGTTTNLFKVKNVSYTDTQKIHHELLDRIYNTKWSEEVCWRLEREYWLRLSANKGRKTRNLGETLERLFPQSIKVDSRIHVLKNIAFPSILEALSGDGLVKRNREEATTLNQGFHSSEKSQRYTTLTYQHRMHPDISAFPRKQFYPTGVLVDGSQTTLDRAWNYHKYSARNIWLDVQGTTLRGNSNKQETEALIIELQAFCDWAEGKVKSQRNDPFDVAILTFYKGQEKSLREALQKIPGNTNRYARFNYKGISIKLATVDYFQGQEADVVFLSMVNTRRDGFMDSPNRLNVSITRARYQLVIIGDHTYFSEKSNTLELKKLAASCHVLMARDLRHAHQNLGQNRKSNS